MRTGRLAIPAAAALLAAALIRTAPLDAAADVAADRFWFCPSPGSIDYRRLFEHPEEWAGARAIVSVFKFYQQHTQTPAPDLVGPNSYDALARAGAFRLLGQWKKKIAIEAGSVKEFYCTPDASGMNESIANTIASLRAVEAAGGTVAYMAQDEPFVSGRARVCGGPALEPTADRVATYVRGVKAAYPSVQIGLIEAYPFSSEAAIETIVDLLMARDAKPAFLHMDTDWHLSGTQAFSRDMTRLKAFAAARNIPLGIIVTAGNTNSDVIYALDALDMTNLIGNTFLSWAQMPDHLIVQSWAVTDTGLVNVPANLDEARLYSHTRVLLDTYRHLRGVTGSSSGKAVPRNR